MWKASNIIARGPRTRTLLVCGVVLTLLQGCSSAPPRDHPSDAFQRAQAAYETADYATTRRLLAPLAEAGDPRAQYVIGYMSFYGQGKPADETAARTWFRRSAAQGFPKAEIALSRITMAEKMHRPETGTRDEAAGDVEQPASDEVIKPSGAPPRPLSQPPGSGAATSPDAGLPRPSDDTADPAPAAVPVPKSANQHRVPDAARTANIPPPTTPPIEQTPRETHRASPVATSTEHTIRSDAWVRSREPAHYTIQLAAIAADRPDAAITFIKRHTIGTHAAYFHFQRAGRSWYGILYGAYPTLRSARVALGKLPKQLQNQRPWIQTFADVQERMSANGGNT